MLIIDAHLDLSMNALQWNRDLLSSVYTTRARENKTVPSKGRAMGTVAFPEMRQGRIALSFATLIARSTGHPAPHIDYGSPTQAYGMAHGQLAYYRALEMEGHVRLVTNMADLDDHMADWENWETAGANEVDTPPLGFVISMEGADPIRSPRDLRRWADRGVRVVGPAWNTRNRYCGGVEDSHGLTRDGVTLVREMRRLHVIPDLSHLTPHAFDSVMAQDDDLVVASHSNAHAVHPHRRNPAYADPRAESCPF